MVVDLMNLPMMEEVSVTLVKLVIATALEILKTK